MKRNYILLLLLMYATSGFCAIIYVKPGGTGNGTSWAQAYGSLTTALQNAQSGDEIWVAQGIYKPTTAPNPDASFIFKNGVKLYGGFAGNEATLNERADTTGTTTILSGAVSANVSSKTVLKISNASSPLNLLDGFTVKDGEMILTAVQDGGAGIQITYSTIEVRNVIIQDNVITINSNEMSSMGGAGLFGFHSAISLHNVIIKDNSMSKTSLNIPQTVSLHGAGIYLSHCHNSSFIKGKIDSNTITSQNSFTGGGGGAYFTFSDNLYLQDL